ncbi:MAG TPA: hypothetical protein VG269_00030 [Tepidisphaeraceae bacterium]|jgi:hypothetical protein|nr:hypothetical protein [Tepidisphaeraceae bacterium]
MRPNAARLGMGLLIGSLSLLAGCEGGPRAAPATTMPATTTSADLPCPYCQMEHYGWRTHRHGTPLERGAEVMKCPHCRSARENLWQGGSKPTCDVCAENRERCPMCRKTQE